MEEQKTTQCVNDRDAKIGEVELALSENEQKREEATVTLSRTETENGELQARI